MRNVTWIVRWFRLSCRPLPIALAISIGLTAAASVRANDEGKELAPVLRLARPYPELKTPPSTIGGGPRNRQADKAAAPDVNLQVSDGWVARDMIGKRAPLMDPSQQPQQQQLAPAPSQPGKLAAVPTYTPPIENQITTPFALAEPTEGDSPILSMPAAPLAPFDAASSSETDERQVKREPSPSSTAPSSNTPLQNPLAGSSRRTWQAADSGPIYQAPVERQLDSGDPQISAAMINNPPSTAAKNTTELALIPASRPAEAEKVIEVAPTAGGWQSNGVQAETPAENADGPSTNLLPVERPAVSSLTAPSTSPTQTPSRHNTQPHSAEDGSQSIDGNGTEGSAELQRMLRELENMKRVAPLKAATTPQQLAPRAPSAQPINAAPANSSVPSTVPVADSVNELQPLARPTMADPAPASSRRTISQRENALPELSAANQPTREKDEPESSEREIVAPAITLPADSDLDVLDLQNQRDLDIPIRRPSIGAGENTATESSPRTSREKSSENADLNSKARDLQEQIERFERGESNNAPRDEIDAGDDALDTAAEPMPLDSLNRPKSVQPLPQKLAPVISAAVQRLDQPIRQALVYYHQRPENAAKRTPWGMLHAILPYGVDANVDASRRYNAIAYLAGNNPNRNLRMLAITRGGRLVARSGVGLQGHQGQMLAIFAQAGVPADYPLYVQRRKFIMNDLVKTEMLACKRGEELTFTLIGLSHYLPTDTKWRAADGQMWDFQRLLSEEMSQPVVGAACGGTHRLMGLSYALKQRKLEGLPLTGQWARAETYLQDFQTYAWQLQNRDGSFSTDWFEGRADNGDLDRKIQTTGHIFEWLLFIAEDDSLQDERVTRSVSFLASQLINERTREWQVGPKGHALRALSLYHRRVFDSDRPWLPEPGTTAQQTRTTNQRR